MLTKSRTPRASRSAGFTLVEMIVVTLLLLIAMVGLLAVFDASARINKNETDVADAQGSVRYGIYQMTRAIRMAGAGGLYVTQAVLNHNDAQMPGITTPVSRSYDNVGNNVTITDTNGRNWPVRAGTDMIEVRGVLFSPLLGFVEEAGCAPCTGTVPLNVNPITGNAAVGEYLNNDATIRPQFAAIDAYTVGATAAKPMFVIVQEAKGEEHACADPSPVGVHRFPQAPYNVGVITNPTRLVSSNTFGNVDFADAAGLGPRFNIELPSLTPGRDATAFGQIKRAGILDDVVFFVTTDSTDDPTGIHPFLAQGIRRGVAFEVSRLADDVEDMQVAYGIDGDGDGSVTRSGTCAPDPTNDPDLNYSTTAGCDEWAPNAVTELAPDDAQFQQQDPFNPTHDGSAIHCPRLHAVMISLVAKAHDPDPTYKGAAATGYKTMNSTAPPIGPGAYRRRIQTLKINLRNFAFQG